MSEERSARIERRLRESLAPRELSVGDESRLHTGHPGARDGRGHFRVTIVSERFEGLGRVGRHRLVYEALASEMRDEVHALAIEAFTPREWEARSGA